VPDPASLKPGDQIQILRVPANDLRQREHEIANHTESAGWTANTIERIILQNPVVRIDRIDEFGSVWYDVELVDQNGNAEYHSLTVYDDDTWELADGL